MKYPCPVCEKRICDSSKKLKITKLTKGNDVTADIILKCRNCKCVISIEIKD